MMTAKEIDAMDEREAMRVCCQLALGWYVPGEDYGAELRRHIQQEKKWVTIETYDPREAEERAAAPYQARLLKRYDRGSFERPYYDAMFNGRGGWWAVGDSADAALYRAFLKAYHEVLG